MFEAGALKEEKVRRTVLERILVPKEWVFCSDHDEPRPPTATGPPRKGLINFNPFNRQPNWTRRT
jgi:hypothetical protein